MSKNHLAFNVCVPEGGLVLSPHVLLLLLLLQRTGAPSPPLRIGPQPPLLRPLSGAEPPLIGPKVMMSQR